MLTTHYPLLATLLRRYFYSGWAFLIPYLAAYLLYYITGWPVNAPTDVSSTAHSPSPFAPPPLIHLYWSLHALHLILAAIALRSWWTQTSTQCDWNASDSQSAPYSSYRLHLLTRIAPWALLALIFYIPGVYLEWPSDPWEHLRRINEWRILDNVGAHSSWHKSSYFIPYSFLSWCTGLRQLFWLDFYYTGICFLLCWQYYRLSRACGLGERASMIFVFVQTLLFGNNIFSFYRYYGISSSIYAQLGAIALTRIVLEWAARGTNLASALQETTTIGNDGGTPLALGIPTASHSSGTWPVNYSFCSLLTTPHSLLHYPSRPTFWHLPSLGRLLAASLCLPMLIAFNHVQGVGIAGLGILAVLLWRLVSWKRATLGCIALAVVAFSVGAILWFGRDADTRGSYQAQGWLNAWHGFSLFDIDSPAFIRSMHILGVPGLLNLAAGISLLRRNHVAGWLVIVPPVALCLPFIALPFAHILERDDTIVTFHRMLFAIPCGLAIVALAASMRRNLSRIGLPFTTFSLLVLIGLSAAFPYQNRSWNSLSITPDDLSLRPVLNSYESSALPHKNRQHASIVSSEPVAFVLTAAHQIKTENAYRQTNPHPTRSAHQVVGALFAANPNLYEKHGNLTKDPMPATPSAWLTMAGTAPVFVSNPDNSQFTSSALQNSKGSSAEVFSAELIAVNSQTAYQVELSVKLAAGRDAICYLAMAWYDQNGVFLNANDPAPRGAGYPSGWSLGTYTYFGLIAACPVHEWTTYRVSFGAGEIRAIPSHAKFVRVGTILNYNQSGDAVVQVTHIRLREKTDASPISDGYFSLRKPLYVFVGGRTAAYSLGSKAALLSGHWSSQQVLAETAGAKEAAIAFNVPDRFTTEGTWIQALPQSVRPSQHPPLSPVLP